MLKIRQDNNALFKKPTIILCQWRVKADNNLICWKYPAVYTPSERVFCNRSCDIYKHFKFKELLFQTLFRVYKSAELIY